MKNRLKVGATLAIAALFLGACASGSDDPAPTSPETEGAGSGETTDAPEAGGDFEVRDPLVLGYSVYDLQNPYWQAYSAGVEWAAEQEGIEVIIADQKSSQAEQVSGSLDLINQGISGLIITPVQPSALPETIDAAHAARIPVVVADIGVAGDYDAYIQSNNNEGGVLAAEYMISQFEGQEGPFEVGVIELHAGSVVGEERVAGFKATIEADERFTVVASLDGNDTVDGGFSAAQDMLSANPNLIGIYAANDDSAIGASRAMEAAGVAVADGFVLIGFDGSDPAQELIDQGVMSATVAQDPFGQGAKAVEIVLALARNEGVTFDDAETRTVFFPVEVVNSENLQEFRDSRANQGN